MAFRNSGLPAQSQHAVEFVASRDITDLTVLDIGFGVGGVHFELLRRGAASVTGVEISDAYLEAAQELAMMMGHADVVDYRRGDFTQLADDVSDADVVVLDRSMCCYPDWRGLMRLSIARTRRFYVLILPRDQWYVRWGGRMLNAVLFMIGHPFRIHLHPRDAIERAILDAGFGRACTYITSIWESAVYERASS